MVRSSPRQRQKLSPVPSWITLGFVLGALTVWAFLKRPERPANMGAGVAGDAAIVAGAQVEEPKPRNVASLADRPSFNVVDAVFELHRAYAFWEDDRTQIALWNSVTGEYSDFFEVYRTDDATFYRPIEKITWWLIDGYGPEEGLIRFAETNDMRLRRYAKAGILPESRRLPPPPPPQFDLAP